MAVLKSISRLPDSKTIIINETWRFLDDLRSVIIGNSLTIRSGNQTVSFSGNLNDVEINGIYYTDPDEASNALESIGIGNFKSGSDSGGGGVVSPTIHNELSGRSASNAHPFSSITGLEKVLDDIKKQITESTPTWQ